MIVVEIYRNKENYIKRYKISGHANYADHGQDIVCAAVSILGQTILLSLGKVVGLEKDLKYKIQDGFLDVKLPKEIDNSILEKTQIVLDTFLIGIKSLIDSYPEYIKLKNGRCNWWLKWIYNYLLLKKE